LNYVLAAVSQKSGRQLRRAGSSPVALTPSSVCLPCLTRSHSPSKDRQHHIHHANYVSHECTRCSHMLSVGCPSDSQPPSRGEGCEYPEMGKPKADTVCTWYQVIGRGVRTEHCVCRSAWSRLHVRLVSLRLPPTSPPTCTRTSTRNDLGAACVSGGRLFATGQRRCREVREALTVSQVCSPFGLFILSSLSNH